MGCGTIFSSERDLVLLGTVGNVTGVVHIVCLTILGGRPKRHMREASWVS